jgi:hypothetical protein
MHVAGGAGVGEGGSTDVRTSGVVACCGAWQLRRESERATSGRCVYHQVLLSPLGYWMLLLFTFFL